uniref:LAGLIDADG endonuclease n=1 Tax=Orbilia oligospora TaxID=2813651 RepID=A0A481ZKX4_ORBOL|nr:LAGLIDADG endonuclease [Orbilia oligospora]QBL01989.1 LAGLIDADG endonuclease [Orbilia oligospora]
MIKRKIENLGSNIIHSIINEQRADDSKRVKSHLRYALMDLEINYRFRMSSNHLNILKRSYSSLIINSLDNLLSNLNPLFLTGFSDDESNFTVIINKSKSTNICWTV